MSIKVAIRHSTQYQFDRLVSLMPHVVRLRPAPHCRTGVQSYSLRVTPEKHFINWQQDPFGNHNARLVFPDRTRELCIDVEVVAEMVAINPFDFFLEESAEQFPFSYEDQLKADLGPYLQLRESGPNLMHWLSSLDRSAAPTVDFLVRVNQRLQQEISYLVRMEPGVQSCEQTLEKAIGSCRDTAWLLVQVLRHLGLAARFVSGYLVQLAADVKALDGPSGPAEDFTDLHAWAELYLPGAGWVGLDPTSGLFAGEGHLPLACTPDPASAAPITGATDPCEVTFTFSNRVERIHEDPRVTRPYTESQWQSILSLGDRVDVELDAGDVRLTMGGEPTFISIDDREGPEWNIAAMGEHKKELAFELLMRLRARYSEASLVHLGQGKWYPGEPLPRWIMSAFWRTDGVPLWRDDRWLALNDADAGHDADTAERFAARLAERLGLAPEYVVPGYEDVFYALWREGTLPANVDPFDSKLADPLERRRLRSRFEQGLDRVIGFALPLKWREGSGAGCWTSSAWEFRHGRMYLVPGDSPMGLRLPLESLPWQAPEQREAQIPADHFAPPEPLPGVPPAAGGPVPAQAGADTAEIVHTALCTEVRQGRLHVFLPPVTRLEQFVALVREIEDTAAELGVPVILEGYEPPRDPRLQVLQITPDPGVIEVNIHPAKDWRDLVANTTTLYELARECRLGTDKFMLDGKHTGTGGGNHVTLGGPTAPDSPMLRRPDVLRSLITYWQNHPSLSYLFSGMFIGPTSQAPRVDEARDDNLYELEIALKMIADGESMRPWQVDRTLRNFLVDLTGNTHRSEFCIDKLYSPDSAAGRRGLVEFRAFEMPPHAQMSLVQMLLLRALIARFWRQPLPVSLVRWGTELHDRFMLPHYVWQDFSRVINDLVATGYAFDPEWFVPFREFRFPRYGTIQVHDIELELRAAIEPWHVLGEESTGQGTARYVDSSMERLQVLVRRLPERRYLVTCNGRVVPLRATGTRGEYVAGVRYKAWDPSSALHPTISIHSPLVFDIVDTANNRSLGGCTYHVVHPGGRNFETFPVNANEAEGRRLARFWSHGHSPGQARLVSEEPHPDHPCTLDLRFPLRSA